MGNGRDDQDKHGTILGLCRMLWRQWRARWHWSASETWLLFRTPVAMAWKQMLHILSLLMLVTIGSCCKAKMLPKIRCGALNLSMCMYAHLSCAYDWTSACVSLSVLCFVFVMQVEAGWLPGELLGDSTHSQHLSQPRQSPSLPGLLRKAHRSVQPGLCLALWWSEREKAMRYIHLQRPQYFSLISDTCWDKEW